MRYRHFNLLSLRGEYLLKFFGISLPAFQIAGGLSYFFWISLDMLRAEPRHSARLKGRNGNITPVSREEILSLRLLILLHKILDIIIFPAAFSPIFSLLFPAFFPLKGALAEFFFIQDMLFILLTSLNQQSTIFAFLSPILSRFCRECLPRSIRRLPFPDLAAEPDGQRARRDNPSFWSSSFFSWLGCNILT